MAALTLPTVPTSSHGRPRWSNEGPQGERVFRQQASGISVKPLWGERSS